MTRSILLVVAGGVFAFSMGNLALHFMLVGESYVRLTLMF